MALIAMTAQSATIQQIEDIKTNWPEAGLSLSLESGESDRIVLGDNIRYRLSGNQLGSCYLLHLDSHGDATLLKPGRCDTATGDGGDFSTVFPDSDTLSVGTPIGTERVFAFLLDRELPQSERLLDEGQSFAVLATQADFDLFVNEISEAVTAGRVAVTVLTYLVDARAEDVQFTTRGIIRKVVEGSDPETDSKQNIVATFDVQSIQFAFGSAELTQSSQMQLDAFGAALQSAELDGIQLRVAGHTDDIGETAYNQNLSEQRAHAVKNYFETNYKIHDERLNVEGLGEEQPIVPNDSEENRAKNRRVEMLFVTP